MSEHALTQAGKCANCHTPLRGPYCFACGQRAESHIHSFWGFLREAAEGITHADSRVWRTLWPLLFRPGFLTVEYRQGRRARYLPPFRLYLVITVLFFLVAAAMPREMMFLNPGGIQLDDVAAEPKETPEQRAERICNNIEYRGPAQAQLQARFNAGCRKMMADEGRGLGEGMLHNMPRALFVLLPLLALVMRLMYLRRYYVEHLLYFVHTHSFFFLLLLLYLPVAQWLEATWAGELLTLAVMLYIPWYLFRSLRRVYGQGWWVSFAKFCVLSFAYVTCAALMLALTTFYTLLTL